MKKGIIVLLITVLVAGVAFAGTLKGSAGLSFKVDLDAKTWGFSNDKAWEYSFDFEFDTTKVEVGEHKTDLWAELAISGSATTGLDKAAAAEGEFHCITLVLAIEDIRHEEVRGVGCEVS